VTAQKLGLLDSIAGFTIDLMYWESHFASQWLDFGFPFVKSVKYL